MRPYCLLRIIIICHRQYGLIFFIILNFPYFLDASNLNGKVHEHDQCLKCQDDDTFSHSQYFQRLHHSVRLHLEQINQHPQLHVLVYNQQDLSHFFRNTFN